MILTSYKNAFLNYFEYKGKTGYSEFWSFTILNFVFLLILIPIEMLIVDNIINAESDVMFEERSYGIPWLIFILVTIIPQITITLRRLNDVGKSKSLIFLPILPFFSLIFFFNFSDEYYSLWSHGGEPLIKYNILFVAPFLLGVAILGKYLLINKKKII
jgi:uncharacterized membrane protein YhaH (DUF805 family)